MKKNYNPDWDEILSAYLDGELDDLEAQKVRRRLETDAEFREALEALEATVNEIQMLPKEATPENELWTDIEEQIGGSGWNRSSAGNGWWPFNMKQTVAVILASILGPGAVLAGARAFRPEPPPPPRAPAAAPSIGPGMDSLSELALRLAEQIQRDVARALEDLPTSVPGSPQSHDALGQFDFQFDFDNMASGEELTETLLEGLLTALENHDPDARAEAARTLGQLHAGDAVDALNRALRADENDEVRRWAAWSLGMIEADEGISTLVRAVRRDSSAEVRRWSAWSLGMIEDDEAVSALTSAVRRDSDPEVRRWASWALGVIEDEEAVPALNRALSRDESSEVRRWAAWALGMIESEEAIDALSEALEDPDPEVSRWAAWALSMIAN